MAEDQANHVFFLPDNGRHEMIMKKNLAFIVYVGFMTSFFFAAIIILVAQKLNATLNELFAMQAFTQIVIIGATIPFLKKYVIRPDPHGESGRKMVVIQSVRTSDMRDARHEPP